MKKFWTLFLLCVFSIIAGVMANEVEENSPVANQGRTYQVTVTYDILYDYYDAASGETVAEGVYVNSGAQIFNVYAETPDEAESEAKVECSTVCRRYNRYVGEKMYRNIKCKVYETRRVSSARAK